MPSVALFGVHAEGRVTQVRRQGGERGEAVSNRYTYMISYDFKLSDGRIVTGHTQRIGDYFSPKHLTKGKSVDVRYFPFLPSVSVIDFNWGGLVENMLAAIVGVILVWLPHSSRAKKKAAGRVASPRQ